MRKYLPLLLLPLLALPFLMMDGTPSVDFWTTVTPDKGKPSSMAPVFLGGEVLLVTAVRMDQVRLNDIIVFRNTRLGINIIHRVIAIRKAANGELYFWTKGDNNSWVDMSLVPDVRLAVTEREFMGVVYPQPGFKK